MELPRTRGEGRRLHRREGTGRLSQLLREKPEGQLAEESTPDPGFLLRPKGQGITPLCAQKDAETVSPTKQFLTSESVIMLVCQGESLSLRNTKLSLPQKGAKVCSSPGDSLLGVFIFQKLHVCLFACFASSFISLGCYLCTREILHKDVGVRI